MEVGVVTAQRLLGLASVRLRPSVVLLVAAAMVSVVLLVPVVFGPPAPLTSDESLYLAEGLAIASGDGPRYPSGEIVHHRAPLFPALLALPLKLSGDPAAAYWVPRLAVLALVGATFVLARSLFGSLAGAVAALLVSANAFLRFLGNTLFLDGVQTLFMLVFLAACWRALENGCRRQWTLAALSFAGAFLTKESAIQWLPLPLALVLLSSGYRRRSSAAGLAVFYGIAGLALVGWWTWVLVVTGRVYFWGYADARLAAWLGVAGVALAASLLAWVVMGRLAPSRLPVLARVAGLAVVGGSVAAIFYHMEFRGGWPFGHAYMYTVPRYLWHVARLGTEPWPLVLAALAWALARAPRDRAARVVVLGLVLYLPFAALVANRWLQQRDLLPMTYLAYVAVGGFVADAAGWFAKQGAVRVVATIAVVAFGLFSAQQTMALLGEQRGRDAEVVTQDDWDNPLARELAWWIHTNIPDGTPIMASRLYYSHLYVLDRGQHPILQLPTVRVEPRPGEAPFLRPMSTMFRWEDHRMWPPEAEPRWLYVVRYPVKQYYIALSERDLLGDIMERGVGYVVLTGEDAGYSSLSYLDYFLENPAFTLIHRDERSVGNAAYVFRVDREKLSERPYRARTTSETLEALARETDLSVNEVARLVDSDGVDLTNGAESVR